jgi:hypothetical protein
VVHRGGRGQRDDIMIGSSTNFSCRTVAAMTRLYPFVSGCGIFANSRVVEVVASPSDNDVWAQVEGGYACVPLRDLAGRAMYFVGHHVDDEKPCSLRAQGIAL